MDTNDNATATSIAILRAAAWLLTGVMMATVIVGLATAPDGAVAELGRNVWGRVTIIDLYLTLGAIGAWIMWREPSRGRGALWCVLVVTTGSAAVWAYVALAATGSTDARGVLLGRHS